MWDKHDWEQFYDIAQRAWQRRRPPWPVAPAGPNRVLPVVGFSLSELDDAGINPRVAERLGLPVDAARIGVYSANVSALRDFVRSARQRNSGEANRRSAASRPGPRHFKIGVKQSAVASILLSPPDPRFSPPDKPGVYLN
jgi:hypothetical protein